MNIRPARKEDAKQIATIHIKARKDGYQGIIEQSYLDNKKVTLKQIQNITKYIINSTENYLVYENKKGEICGFIDGGTPRDKNPQYPHEIYSFYVDPIHQKSGIWTQLFNAFQERIQHQPCYLWTLPWSRGDWFYSKYGGEICAQSTIDIGGKTYPLVCYAFDTNPK